MKRVRSQAGRVYPVGVCRGCNRPGVKIVVKGFGLCSMCKNREYRARLTRRDRAQQLTKRRASRLVTEQERIRAREYARAYRRLAA